MVPASVPRPDLLVTATGVLEILGAIGVAVPRVVPYAALRLAVMLVAVFAANIRAARQRLTTVDRPVEAFCTLGICRTQGVGQLICLI